MALFRILAGRRTSGRHFGTGRRLQATTITLMVLLLVMMKAVRPVARVQRIDGLGPIRRRVDDPVLREVVENVFGQLLALRGQPILHLALVGEEDLLHPPQDHLVRLDIATAAAAILTCGGALPRCRLPRWRRVGARDEVAAVGRRRGDIAVVVG